MNRSLSCTLVQSHLHWEDRDANLAMFEEKLKQLPQGAEVVILPEMFNTGYSMDPVRLGEAMDGITVEWMKRMASEKRIILTGSLIIYEEGNYYNRMIWMQPDGQYGSYDKRHLFAHAGEDKEFSAGSKKLLTRAKGWVISPLVCYDLRFPVWSRQGGDELYDLLIYVANWPEKRVHAWRTLLQARAVENQSYVIGVNRCGEDGNGLRYPGESMVVSPMGEVVFSMGAAEDMVTLELQKDELLDIREKFKFLNDRDTFLVV